MTSGRERGNALIAQKTDGSLNPPSLIALYLNLLVYITIDP